MKTVLVFGTFDGIHPGHDFFLKEARALGDRLVVCLARDTIVEELKGHPPRRPEIERREALAESSFVDQVLYGDRDMGSYRVLEEVNPSVIALGYDQEGLKQDLGRYLSSSEKQIDLVELPSFYPEQYKSSLMNLPAADNRPGRPSA